MQKYNIQGSYAIFLLSRNKLRGNNIFNSLEMLRHQARLGFKLWFDIDPVITQDIKRNILPISR